MLAESGIELVESGKFATDSRLFHDIESSETIIKGIDLGIDLGISISSSTVSSD